MKYSKSFGVTMSILSIALAVKIFIWFCEKVRVHLTDEVCKIVFLKKKS